MSLNLLKRDISELTFDPRCALAAFVRASDEVSIFITVDYLIFFFVGFT